MKRSEAKKLFLEFYEQQTSQNMRFTGDDFLYLAEYIIGMLPPYKPGEEPFGDNEGYISPPYWESEEERNSEL
jgi:hypothetical protein